MSTNREFSAEDLARFVRPSVDQIADALDNENSTKEEIQVLAEQFNLEVCSMVYGYSSWPKVVERNVEGWLDQAYWQDLHTAVLRQFGEQPPEMKTVLKNWGKIREQVSAGIDENDRPAIKRLSRAWHEEALDVHDRYMNYAAILVSEVARQFGAETMQQVLTEIMNPDAMGITPEMPFRERVEKLVGFTRLHLLPFRLSEDDEKMTFMPSPCPSGGRQIQAGLYDEGRPGEIVDGPSPVTYELDSLPSYCCHESALEAASIRHFGAPMFIVDPAVQLGYQPCHIHVYKDLTTIPERYFSRVGLEKDIDIIASSQ